MENKMENNENNEIKLADEIKLVDVKKRLEAEGMEFTKTIATSLNNSMQKAVHSQTDIGSELKPILTDPSLNIEKKLTSFLSDGIEKFKSETGHYPSYSDIRDMWG